MASHTGRGDSFAESFRRALTGLSTGRERPSYNRKTVLGQFRQLFATRRGYEALEAAGLEVRQRRTIQGWLEGTSEPNKENSAAIRRAYDAMSRGIPSWVTQGMMGVSGRVCYGDDCRDRGTTGSSPLRVDLRAGSWDRVRAALDDAPDRELEDLIADDLIAPSVGDSYPWSFPGGGYRTLISS